jgi:hypothetical protein
MAAVSRERVNQVVQLLWEGVYEAPFRGKTRGRFAISREQLRNALKVERLHPSTVRCLQDRALCIGLVIIDLDDLFACVETKVVRGYRRPTSDLFSRLCDEYVKTTDDEVDDGVGETVEEDEDEA